MRKNKEMGFMLTETLIVSVFVGVTLIYIFVQLRNISNQYDQTFVYNTTNALYGADKIKKNILALQYDVLEKDIKDNPNEYIDITSCDLPYYKPVVGKETAFKNYCQLLYEKLNVKKILFSKQDLTNIKTKVRENRDQDHLSQKLIDFINYVPYDKGEDGYRIIVEYKDDTFASIKVKR